MTTNFVFTVRKWHKWLSLVIGVQALFWLLGGVYMVVIDLDFIHGDHLVQNMMEPLPEDLSALKSFADIQRRFPDAHRITLATWMGQPHYRIKEPEGGHLVDAITGKERSPLSREDAVAIAQYHYTRDQSVLEAVLLTGENPPPTEIQTRTLPLWQIRFDDFGSSTFYISPDEGHLVTRRHTFWRVFDFVWMLHIMDYDERNDVNNNLFRVAAFTGFLMSIFGLWLAFYSFSSKKRNQGQSAGRLAGERS